MGAGGRLLLRAPRRDDRRRARVRPARRRHGLRTDAGDRGGRRRTRESARPGRLDHRAAQRRASRADRRMGRARLRRGLRLDSFRQRLSLAAGRALRRGRAGDGHQPGLHRHAGRGRGFPPGLRDVDGGRGQGAGRAQRRQGAAGRRARRPRRAAHSRSRRALRPDPARRGSEPFQGPGRDHRHGAAQGFRALAGLRDAGGRADGIGHLRAGLRLSQRHAVDLHRSGAHGRWPRLGGGGEDVRGLRPLDQAARPRRAGARPGRSGTPPPRGTHADPALAGRDLGVDPGDGRAARSRPSRAPASFAPSPWSAPS